MSPIGSRAQYLSFRLIFVNWALLLIRGSATQLEHFIYQPPSSDVYRRDIGLPLLERLLALSLLT